MGLNTPRVLPKGRRSAGDRAEKRAAGEHASFRMSSDQVPVVLRVPYPRRGEQGLRVRTFHSSEGSEL